MIRIGFLLLGIVIGFAIAAEGFLLAVGHPTTWDQGLSFGLAAIFGIGPVGSVLGGFAGWWVGSRLQARLEARRWRRLADEDRPPAP